MADLLAPKVQRDPAEQDGGRDGGHDAVGALVPGLADPRVCVEGEEEPEEGLEAHDGQGDLARHGAVSVDDVDQGDVCALDDCKVY